MSLITRRTALLTQECCSRCRRPASRCRLECGAPATYPGVLLRGEWRDLQAPGRRKSEFRPPDHGASSLVLPAER